MKYFSVCSGIEAASVAWHGLGWKPLAFSEVEPFPRAVLAHHYPDVPLHGDFTTLRNEPWIVDADILVGGTPCQAFSVAGLRNSLSDDRGNLTLEFVRLADAIDDVRHAAGKPPAIVVWENVPGVLSVRDNAFGCFLAALAGDAAPYDPPRRKWTNAGVVDGPARTVAWRILDAQYFGLAQRRRRVFVVASARDGFDPATVLLEFEGLRRDSPPRRETRQIASTIPSRSTAGGGLGTDFDCDGGVITLAHGQGGAEVACERRTTLTCIHEAPIAAYVSHSLRAEGFDASEDGTGRGTPLVPVAFSYKDSGNDATPDLSPTLRALGAFDVNGGGQMAVAVALRGREGGGTAELGGDIQNALRASSGGGDKPHILTSMAVRRLTPVECERLQGFPDGYTMIPWKKKPAADCPDGPRYKALGNSMAVPVMRWIGRRIQEIINAQRPDDSALHPGGGDNPEPAGDGLKEATNGDPK